MTEVLTFMGLAALIVALPGPATALVMSNTFRGGRESGLWTAAGLFGADLVWAAATVAGLTALLVASQAAFDAVRLIGAAYLISFGVRLLLDREEHERPAAARGVPRRSHGVAGRSLRQGLVCNLSNPKTLVVFTSVVPQMAPDQAGPATLALYGLLFASVGFCSSVVYALASARARQVATAPRLRRLVLRISGVLIVGFGVRLAVEKH